VGLLLPGESIVWSGEPVRHRLFRGEDAFLIPFSLFWGGFAIFWEASALRAAGSDAGFAVSGLPFVAVGTEYLASLPPPVVTENEDGSGDLAFGSFPSTFTGFGNRRRNNSAFGYEPIVPFRFRDIPDVLRVRDLIQASQAAAHPH